MGGAHYVRHLATAARAVAPETRVSFICGDALVADWNDVENRIDVLTHGNFLRRLRHWKPTLRRALTRDGVEFVYPLTYDNKYNLGLEFPIGAQFGKARWAGWIPDFQDRYLPEFFSSAELDRRETLNRQLAIEAPRIVCSSRNAADDFRRFYPQQSNKADVLHFGSTAFNHSNETPDCPPTPDKFFLICNQFWKHKNHRAVFEALKILRARGMTPPVLCTGRLDDYRDRPYVESIQALLKGETIGSQVRLLGAHPPCCPGCADAPRSRDHPAVALRRMEHRRRGCEGSRPAGAPLGSGGSPGTEPPGRALFSAPRSRIARGTDGRSIHGMETGAGTLRWKQRRARRRKSAWPSSVAPSWISPRNRAPHEFTL